MLNIRRGNFNQPGKETSCGDEIDIIFRDDVAYSLLVPNTHCCISSIIAAAISYLELIMFFETMWKPDTILNFKSQKMFKSTWKKLKDELIPLGDVFLLKTLHSLADVDVRKW